MPDVVTNISYSLTDDDETVATSDLLSFFINSDVIKQGTPLKSPAATDEDLCALPQTAFIVYRDAKLFNDPSLSQKGKKLASGVISAQVGVSDITDLDSRVRGTFKVQKNISAHPVGNVAENLIRPLSYSLHFFSKQLREWIYALAGVAIEYQFCDFPYIQYVRQCLQFAPMSIKNEYQVIF